MILNSSLLKEFALCLVHVDKREVLHGEPRMVRKFIRAH